MIQHIEFEHGYRTARREICEYLKSLCGNNLIKINKKSIRDICNILEEYDFEDVLKLGIWQKPNGELFIKESKEK